MVSVEGLIINRSTRPRMGNNALLQKNQQFPLLTNHNKNKATERAFKIKLRRLFTAVPLTFTLKTMLVDYLAGNDQLEDRRAAVP